MATQFAINEPDSFSSANQTYTPAENFVFNGLGLQSFEIILIPDDVLFGFDAIDFIGDHDYFDIPLPAHRSRPFLPWSFSGTVTVDVTATDGSPFDGVLTLYAGKSSTVVATGISLGAGKRSCSSMAGAPTRLTRWSYRITATTRPAATRFS
jgi:hypothetical protein